MFEVSFSPSWAIRHAERGALGPRVIELLVRIDELGSLAAACVAASVSYRHAWQLLREGEQMFGQALLVMARGKGSQLTPLGERLVWAHRRTHARLSPVLDTLASELSAEIGKALSASSAPLRVHASHGFAVELLRGFLDSAGVAHELRYCGTAEALASLGRGSCDVAGFHVPLGEFEAEAVEHYRPMINPRTHRLIRLATRRQGLMLATGNPKKIYDVSDLTRPDVRFINRQLGSGTRYLLDLMLRSRGIEAADIRGYEQWEYTHAAVAAFVASGMADAGFGVEVPARKFKLDFLPTQQERYLLACERSSLDTPDMRALLGVLGSSAYRTTVNGLPGYQAHEAGTVVTFDQAFAAEPAGKRKRRSS